MYIRVICLCSDIAQLFMLRGWGLVQCREFCTEITQYAGTTLVEQGGVYSSSVWTLH